MEGKTGKSSEAYRENDRKWRTASKLIFGKDLGELDGWKEWLSELKGKSTVERSSVSGKMVVYSVPHYSKKAKWVGFDEVDFEKKYPPLSINALKDIDSIVEAVSDRLYFCGNVILGNSKFVEQSSNMVDTFYAYNCEQVAYLKYTAYCTEGTYSESLFGCHGFGYTSFSILSAGIYKSARCFGVSRTDASSDCYYSHGLYSCQDCMFCFNVKGKRNMIGNLQLSQQEYAKTKAKLLAEMLQELAKKKRLPTLIEIAESEKPDYSGMRASARGMGAPPAPETSKQAIEKAFSDTSGVVFGQKLSGIDRYCDWLKLRTRATEPAISCASGRPLVVSDYNIFMKFPRDRLLSIEEADFLGGRLAIGEAEAKGITLGNAAKTISEVAYFSADWPVGKVINAIDSPIAIDSSDCYKNILAIESKHCACSYIPRNSERIYGSFYPRLSSFCIKCYNSAKLSRCFEVDSSRDCSDCYFCHNCENMHDSMFCFNVKNMKNAIGNVALARKEYLEIKKRVLSGLQSELARDGKISLSIYNMPGWKQKAGAKQARRGPG